MRTKDALTEAAQRCQMEQERYRAKGIKNVPNGTLEKIIATVEDSKNLSGGSLSSYTVVNRARRDNITGEALQRVSPLQD
jgi:hypothetical protein